MNSSLSLSEIDKDVLSCVVTVCLWYHSVLMRVGVGVHKCADVCARVCVCAYVCAYVCAVRVCVLCMCVYCVLMRHCVLVLVRV